MAALTFIMTYYIIVFKFDEKPTPIGILLNTFFIVNQPMCKGILSSNDTYRVSNDSTEQEMLDNRLNKKMYNLTNHNCIPTIYDWIL